LRDEKLKEDKIEEIFQFKVIFSNKTIAIQRIWIKSKKKKN
jgi:hypothetical protein